MSQKNLRSRWEFNVTRRCQRAIAWSKRASSAFARPWILVAMLILLVPVWVILIKPALRAAADYNEGSPSTSAASNIATAGKVLIAGGGGNSSVLASVELYDPDTNSFAAVGNTPAMNVGRAFPTATLLTSGKVLIAGGESAASILSSTELYDPTTDSFAAPGDTAVMNFARISATATLLASGKVLIVGLTADPALDATTELYDPTTNSFAAGGDTATMNTGRYQTTATLLPSGKVLIAGGCCDSNGKPLSSTELYDPATNSFAPVGDTAVMNDARGGATATLLLSGKVLIAGGGGISGDVLTSTELYDPKTNSFAARSDTAVMNIGRAYATATLLQSGKVLIAGGADVNGNSLASTELYGPKTNTFAPARHTAKMNTERVYATATLLPSGKVLIAGGLPSVGNLLSSTELYDPTTNSFAAPGNTATMNDARDAAAAVLLLPAASPTPTPTPTPTAVVLLPAALDFGAVKVGQSSAPSDVTLTNGTAKKITIRGTAIGVDYKVVSTTCSSTLAARRSCDYSISFAPQRAGTKNEAFRVFDSANNSPQTVKLHGVAKRR